MNAIPLPERPRERCLENGPSTLSLRECLAVLLGSGPPGAGALGVARAVLEKPGTGYAASEEERAFFTAMESSGVGHLLGIDGLGPAGRARLLAAFEIGRRYAIYRQGTLQPPSSTHERLPLRLPAGLPEHARETLSRVGARERCEPREWLGFVPIYRSGQVGELCIVERGVRTHVNVDPAELFARLLALRPRGFVLFHNHPSGNLNPSLEDFHLTRSIESLARPLGLRLFGHWIVAPEGETWLKDFENPAIYRL
jgi:DNA repair protein RadC